VVVCIQGLSIRRQVQAYTRRVATTSVRVLANGSAAVTKATPLEPAHAFHPVIVFEPAAACVGIEAWINGAARARSTRRRPAVSRRWVDSPAYIGRECP
jgi:hypothetical protein